jgi:hypothetical protein
LVTFSDYKEMGIKKRLSSLERMEAEEIKNFKMKKQKSRAVKQSFITSKIPITQP